MKYINELSYLSAPIRKRLSPFASYLLRNKLITTEDTILDYGCGYGTDAGFLREKGFSVDCYDPYYFPEFPTKQYSVVLCSYVLDVLTRDYDRLEVIRKAWSLCSGRFYLTAGKVSQIYLRAVINIGTRHLSQKLVNRIFSVSVNSPNIKTYSQEEAITAIALINNSGWVAPNGCSIGGFCTHFDTFNYDLEKKNNKYPWAANRYYRLKSNSRNLPSQDGFVKSLYLCKSGDRNNPKYLWAVRGLLRRNAINRIKFHTTDFSYLDLFIRNNNWDFLDKTFRPIPDKLNHPQPTRKPKQLIPHFRDY